VDFAKAGGTMRERLSRWFDKREGAPTEEVHWPLATRIAFRFGLAFFALDLPFPLDTIPSVSDIIDPPVTRVWDALVTWVGSHVLHIASPILTTPNGSGDRTYDFVALLCALVFSSIVTLLWSVLDRKRPTYARLNAWFRLYVSLYLGANMLNYGSGKVVPAQFPPPLLSALVERIGDASPMRLLWTFMGASKSYEFFAGSAEVLGGFLILVPRLRALGALVCLGVLTNIVMLNLCYDVPVKLFSIQLLASALILLAPDAQRLARLFFLGGTTQLVTFRALFKRVALNQAMIAAQLVLGVLYFQFCLAQSIDQLHAWTEKPPLYGIWSVDQFSIDGKQLPPTLSESRRWRSIVLDANGRMMLDAPDYREKMTWSIDQKHKSISLTAFLSQKPVGDLQYVQPAPEQLELHGHFAGHMIVARLRHVPRPSFLLETRGFHWINEMPFSR
jgi:hypothetical protein